MSSTATLRPISEACGAYLMLKRMLVVFNLLQVPTSTLLIEAFSNTSVQDIIKCYFDIYF